jgi:[acyl-carrier-protein] S-malonyltransferase
MAKAKGAKAIPLSVSGAFHSRLMQPAVEGMKKVFDNITFCNPAIPVIANTTAQPLAAGSQIRDELINQLCNGIQWQRSMEYMINQAVSSFIEIGPGKVLTGLAKRINKSVATSNIGDMESVKSLTKI